MPNSFGEGRFSSVRILENAGGGILAAAVVGVLSALAVHACSASGDSLRSSPPTPTTVNPVKTPTETAPGKATREPATPDGVTTSSTASSLPAEETGESSAADLGAITVVTIRGGNGGKVGPDTYRAGATPGFNADVFTRAGQLDYSECYINWTLLINDQTVVTDRSRCRPGGFTMFSTGELPVGDAIVRAEVQSDWGAQATQDYGFEVVP